MASQTTQPTSSLSFDNFDGKFQGKLIQFGSLQFSVASEGIVGASIYMQVQSNGLDPISFTDDFDFIHWNAISGILPQGVHEFYFLYKDNGKVSVSVPAFFLSISPELPLPEDEHVLSQFTYQSSIDPELVNLSARLAYKSSYLNKPILVVLDGWGETGSAFDEPTLKRYVDYGFVVIAPLMRPQSDASGRELQDIVDAVEKVVLDHTEKVNPLKKIVAGYSGGGGNVLGLYVKFPDYFNLYVDHFGMVDYGYWATTNPQFANSIHRAIGGNPTQKPQEYKSRNIRESINNGFGLAPLIVFHDVDDPLVSVEHSKSLSNPLITYHESDQSDTVRWVHEYPTNQSQIKNSESIWVPLALNSQPVSLPNSGQLKALGYCKTRSFEVWLGDGRKNLADLVFHLGNDEICVLPHFDQSIDIKIIKQKRI